jgi:hypothetical protein
LTSDRSDSDIRLLAEKIADVQSLEAGHGERLARKISEADDDIWAAAMQWAATGQMPAEPVIEGQSPARLHARMSPSQVFTALMGLRSDPERALSGLRHFPGGLPRARQPEN